MGTFINNLKNRTKFLPFPNICSTRDSAKTAWTIMAIVLHFIERDLLKSDDATTGLNL